MASTYTDGLAVEIIGSGDKAGSWGDVTNNNLKALEEGVSRYAEIGAAGSNTSTLNIPDGQTAYTDDSKGRSAVIKWTGAIASGDSHTVTLQVGGAEATQARFTAINGLSSSKDLVIDTASGTSLTIPNGYSADIHLDGSGNVVNSFSGLAVDKIALKNNEIISNETNDQIIIAADTVKVGDDGAATLSSNGNFDLTLKTGNSTTGSITITDGSSGNIDITPNGTGEVNISRVDIDAGAIDGTIIGAAAAAAGTFTTVTTPILTAAAALGITTVSDNDITITPNGSGKTVMTKVDINGGAIDATPIGANSANTGAFSTLSASGLVTATAGVTLSTSGTLNVGARGIADAGPIAGATTINASGTSTLAAINASGNIVASGNSTVRAHGLIAETSGLLVNAGGLTVNGTTNLNNDGINNAGSISGATTISASGNIVSQSGNLQVSDGNLGVGVSPGGAGSGNISADGLITTSGGISTTGSSTIVSAGRITSGGGLTAGGTITGATTVTANTFEGALTGNVTGNASGSALTVTQAAQTAITSVGTLTNLSVDTVNINNNTIRATDNLILLADDGLIRLDDVTINDGVVSSITTLTADTINGALTGNVTGNVTGSSGSTTGNAATVSTNAALTGDVVTTSGNATAIASGVIINSDIKSDAAIAYSKMEAAGNAPDFNQDTTGNAGSVTNGVYTTSKISVLASTTSSELAGVISNNTGSGSLVFATDSVLVAPRLGTPHSGVMTNVTGTAANLTAGTATLAVSTNGLRTTGNTVVVSGSSQPSDGMVLTATGSAAAQWEDPVVGDITDVLGGTNITVASSGGPQPTVNLDAAVSLATSLTTPTVTSTGVLILASGSNGGIGIAPHGTGTVQITSGLNSAAVTGGIGLTASSSRINFATQSATYNNSLITFRAKDAAGSNNLQFVVSQDGAFIHEDGGQYLNMSSTRGSGGYGLRGTSDGSTSGTLNASNKNGDGWGEVYHAGMASGQGAYFTTTVALNYNGERTFTCFGGAVPKLINCYLVCTTDDAGYTAGDKAQVTSGNQTGANDNFVIVFDGSGSNDCSIVFGANMKLLNPSNNNNTTLTEGSWNFEFHAWK